MGGSESIEMGVICENYFEWKVRIKDLDALRRCIKNKKRYAIRVARGETLPSIS